MRWRHWFFLGISFSASILMAKHPYIEGMPADSPWMTGPLYSPSAHVTPKGHYNVEPYFYHLDHYGYYDRNWKLNKEHHFYEELLEVYTSIGLTQWMNFALTPGFTVQSSQGSTFTDFIDLSTGFDFQILNDTKDNYLPALKFGYREVFPLGRYQHLNPGKHGTDATGGGSYRSDFVLAAGRSFHIRNFMWLSLRCVGACSYSTKVHVQGHNSYGGVSDTDGHVDPPFRYGWDFAAELSLNRHWVLAFDLIGEYSCKRTFKGYVGSTDSGNKNGMEKGPATLYQITPAIEYNWSARYGLITGAWITLCGRDAHAFNAWVIAVNISI